MVTCGIITIVKIKRLKLTNFRQFEKKEIDFEQNWTILVAPNAKGKSTIVEAVYMLANGNSPWTSDHNNIIRMIDGEETPQPNFRIEASVESEDETKTIAIFVQNNNGSTSKQYQIEGQSTTRSKFLQTFHCILFSPDMIDLLMFEPKQRRDFLDSHLSRISNEYADNLTNYNKILRQRNSLLKILGKRRFNRNNPEGNFVPTSQKNTLSFWTDKIVEAGTEIISSRLEFIENINSTNSKLYPTSIKYTPKVNLGDFADMVDKSTIKEAFQTQIDARKEKDLLIGTTTVGPHRDDWYLMNSQDQNLNIYGSRGEKRMAIADVIFKINAYLRDKHNIMSVILLDDISSELDDSNIDIVFKKKVSKDQQVIITTTELSHIPEETQNSAETISL